MAKNLLIVESPAKAKTIEKILGKDYTVKSSFGHIRDLDRGEGAVDVANDFEPHYVITPDKTKVVRDLKNWVSKVDEVWLATDEDREGEAISWHLCEVLGLPPQHTKRIVFREITKPAIQQAIQQPRTVDINLVNAQQARRVLDRLVGYELSGLLWKKVKGGLSAGRVQSVAVKLIVEREREIQQFETTPFFRVDAIFNVKNEQGKVVQLKAEANQRFDDQTSARAFLEQCVPATYRIEQIELRPLKRRPTAPFTTSTLQQEASRKLYFSVKRTMQVAQRLYEAGHITYMRTDSTSMSEVAIQAIAHAIETNYGQQYLQTRRFKSKSASAQEAHEAIRPTYIENTSVPGTRDEQRLYDLIWKRTIASQMADAQLEKTVVTIDISTVPATKLRAEGEVLKFDGFLKVYLESKDDDDDETTKGILPPLTEGQVLPLRQLTATERFTRPPARFTEAALVSKLEELGIGRPSTYAPTISKIMEEGRGYVVNESRDGTERAYEVLTLAKGSISAETKTEITGAVKNRLFATDIGMAVSDFLDEHFEDIMSYSFTAEIEDKLDHIAYGKQEWRDLLRDFYHPFHSDVETALEQSDRVTRERILGKDPKTGLTVLTRLSRRGPVVQLGAPDELVPGEKPRYGNLPNGMNMDDIDLEQALKLFELPKDIGSYEDEVVTIGVGRYGPYVRWGEKFISMGRGTDPHDVDLEQATQLIEGYKEANRPIATYKGEPVTKGKGRFGPFVRWQDTYANVPKKYDFDRLTSAEALEVLMAKLEKESNRYIQQWDDPKIAIENGRWGPFIRFGRENVKLPSVDGKRMTAEEAGQLTLDEVKDIIKESLPTAFDDKKKPTSGKKKAAPKKAAAKKTATKKTTRKKN